MLPTFHKIKVYTMDEFILRSKGEEFVYNICQTNPKCRGIEEMLGWIVKFAYALDGIDPKNEKYTYNNILRGMAIAKGRKEMLSIETEYIAIVCCCIYTSTKTLGYLETFGDEFVKLLDEIDSSKFTYKDDVLDSCDLEMLQSILMDD